MKKPGVEEVRSAWEALASDPAAVAESLIGLAANAESDMVRVWAAEAVLDRLGLQARRDVGIATRTFATPAHTHAAERPRRAVDIATERLAQLAAERENHTRQID